MTDALAAIAENTQRFAGGKAMSKRYMEIMEPRREAPSISGAEAIERVRRKLRG